MLAVIQKGRHVGLKQSSFKYIYILNTQQKPGTVFLPLWRSPQFSPPGMVCRRWFSLKCRGWRWPQRECGQLWSLFYRSVSSFINLPSRREGVWKWINEMTTYSYQYENAFLLWGSTTDSLKASTRSHLRDLGPSTKEQVEGERG